MQFNCGRTERERVKEIFESIAIQHTHMKSNCTGENAMAKAKAKGNRFFSLSVYSRGVVACVVFFSLIVLVLFPFRCSIVSQLLVRISSDRIASRCRFDLFVIHFGLHIIISRFSCN